MSLTNITKMKCVHKQLKLSIALPNSNYRLKLNIRQGIVLKDSKHNSQVIHLVKKDSMSLILISLKEIQLIKMSTPPRRYKTLLLQEKNTNTLPANFRYRLRLPTKIFIHLIKFNQVLSNHMPKITWVLVRIS